MNFGMLILYRARKETAPCKRCEVPIDAGQDYYCLIITVKNGKRFTQRLHLECLNDFTIERRALRRGAHDEAVAKGLAPRRGPRGLKLDPDTIKLRRRLQIYFYKEEPWLELALISRDKAKASRVSRKMVKILRRMHTLDPNLRINIKSSVLDALISYIGGREEAKRLGWWNEKVDSEWLNIGDSRGYPREPLVIADMLVRDLIGEEVIDEPVVIASNNQSSRATKEQVVMDRWKELEIEHPDWGQDQVQEQLKEEGYEW